MQTPDSVEGLPNFGEFPQVPQPSEYLDGAMWT